MLLGAAESRLFVGCTKPALNACSSGSLGDALQSGKGSQLKKVSEVVKPMMSLQCVRKPCTVVGMHAEALDTAIECTYDDTCTRDARNTFMAQIQG